MRLLLACAMALTPVTALAWERLDGPSIDAALSDRALTYDAYTSQVFSASGETIYLTERAAVGRWEVRGDQYCSLWPPSSSWTCYDVDRDGERFRFTDAGGTASVGTYRE